MYETLNIAKFSNSKFIFENIKYIKNNNYLIDETLELHGKIKKISFDSTIIKDNNIYMIKSKGSILMSYFDIKQPKFMFLEVRNKVEIDIDLKLSK